MRTQKVAYQDSITKKGNRYKKTNIAKIVAGGAAAVMSTKKVLLNKDCYINAGINAKNMPKFKNCVLGSKAITATLVAATIVPAVLSALGAGTIVDGVVNKVKAAFADKK